MDQTIGRGQKLTDQKIDQKNWLKNWPKQKKMEKS